MSRKTVDCRESPNKENCTLSVSGEENEVVRACVEHAVSVHGAKDSPELQKQIRAIMKEDTSAYTQQTKEKRAS